MTSSRCLRPFLVLAAPVAVACHAGWAPGPDPRASLGAEADSCAAVRDRVREGGATLADVAPVENEHNKPAPDLRPERTYHDPVPPLVLTYVVLADGTVDSASVTTTGGANPGLFPALQKVVRGWRFTAARYHGCAVAHEMRESFTFGPASD